MENRTVDHSLRAAGAASLILLPLTLMLVFALHFRRVTDFFIFKWSYEPWPARETVAGLIKAAGRGQSLIHDPHVIAYLCVPLLLATALTLTKLLWRAKPWLALTGGALACVGAVYLGGLFGTWSAFRAIGNVPPGQVEGAVAAWEALTTRQGVLLLTTVLSCLSLVGLMVHAAGLFVSRLVPRWSPVFIAAGCVLILIFMDLDNWMFIGSLLMFVGMIPVSRMVWRGDEAGGVTLGELGDVTAGPQKLSLIVPVYNEQRTLGEIVRRVIEKLSDAGARFEVVIVNDGSTDQTGQSAAALAAADPERVRVVDLPKNKGRRAALAVGRAVAAGDRTLFLKNSRALGAEILG